MLEKYATFFSLVLAIDKKAKAKDRNSRNEIS
jgi:hypothetical protein